MSAKIRAILQTQLNHITMNLPAKTNKFT